jgi:RimJ/RimL family protein N-acetyltransferase
MTLDRAPATFPGRVALNGELVRLEVLDPAHHAESLFAASHGADHDPSLWDHLPYGPFPSHQEFTSWLEQRAASNDPLFFAVVDGQTMRPQGMVSFMRIKPEHGVIEIGHIWFGAALQRTRGATEAIFLLGRHAFDDLGYRRLEWKCDALNERSRRAADRFGFTFEGVFRQHMIVKGRNRDTAWFSILDNEWPVVRAAFEAWLAPTNFDAEGRQRLALSVIRANLRAQE